MLDTKFLLDENVPNLINKFLKSKGYSAECGPKGIRNSKVALLATNKKSVLLTRDKHFINSVLFPPKQFFGIVVFRIHPPKAEKLVKALSSLLDETKEFKGKLFVVKEDCVEVEW